MFITIYTTIITLNYFLQLTVVSQGISSGETAGLSLLAMVNPHGVFFALESLGYLIQELVFLLLPLYSQEKGCTKLLVGLSLLISLQDLDLLLENIWSTM